MNRKRAVDTMSFFIWAAVALVAWMYPGEVLWQGLALWGGGALALLFLALALYDRRDGPGLAAKREMAAAADSGPATELVLLSEEGTELRVWGLYGKPSMLIGRDVKENQVDVDLSGSPYAGMVEAEHAVLNFAGGAWHVDDLGSADGITVQKAQDGRAYHLSKDATCRLERGDCVLVGLNRLLLR